ncbi:myoferlin isoform X4 [Ceratitis capitata]|uniref:myoferlin isoform X4 n=1 Tax=Ceratitis capitata TaxID=7213 RepID=UPI000A0FEE70|nr:myoferlin isoform X4 [Ceratitis capitata]
MLPIAQNDCFLNMSQDYLICTTIHKARQLGVFTGETFVRVTLDKAHRTTKPYARSENPYYNEYFVFEIRCTLTELLRLTVLYEVRKKNACKKTISHGELLIDLQSVWNQPNRCFFKKWGRLEASITDVSNITPGACKGYLQIDLAIVSESSDPNTVLRPHEEMLELNKWQINQDFDNIERNMLQNADHTMQCNIRYNVTLYKAVLTKKSDYLIQFRFHPFKGKTNVAKATAQPEWNYSVCFSWTYPSLSQTFVVQILSHEHLQWKAIADYEIHFDEIAFKDKPALGPTYVHFYDQSNSLQYLGRLLVEVVSECLPAGPARDLLTKPVAPLEEKRWWQEETFLVEFLPLQGDFIHGNFSNCKISMKLAENSSNYVECFLKSYSSKNMSSGTSLKYFRQEAPYKAVYLTITMPDNRYKFDSDYYMQEILDLIESELATFKLFQIKYTNQFVLQSKCFKAIIMNLQNRLKEGVEDKRLEYTGFKETTMWDTNRLVYVNSFFEKLPEKLRAMRHKLKTAPAMLIESTIAEVLDQMVFHTNELKSLLATTRLQDEWPTLLIMLSVSGKNDIAVCRLNAKYFLNAPKDKQQSSNSLCWRMRNFIFKSLPEQLEYWPAIIATDVSVSAKGAETTLGAVLIPDSKRFLQVDKSVKCIPAMPSDGDATTLQIGEMQDNEAAPLLRKEKPTLMQRTLGVFKRNKDPAKLPPIDKMDLAQIIDETQYNWWTKYYNSIYTYQETGDLSHLYKHSLIIYSNELERQADLSYMHDWAEPVKLVHGVKYKKNSMPKEESYATLKLNIKLVPCKCGTNDAGDGIMLRPLAAALNPRYQAELHTLTDLTKIIVRVYVVQGVQLRPHDKSTKSDAYVRLHLGGKTIANRAHYVPNESNPVFGKCFQMDAVLPRDNMLEVSIFDRNLFTDDYIGSTYIDLEDRWRTRHRAAVGIPREYSKNGYNKWRNIATPFEILAELCSKSDLPAPKFLENRIEVDGLKFKDETRLALGEELQERLSLTALHHLDQLPSFGYKLVPEHVETRTLYRRDCPGIEQGKIQLWIELYEGNLNIPPPIDITPHPPQVYELRVVVYGCTDLTLDERNIFGKKMSDVGVKGWCADKDQSQATDIHYRSFNGEAAFNWRMVFPLKYSANEDMMVIKMKSGVLNEYEVKHPPVLYLQVWDNDLITKDDFLGMLELNLSNFTEPCTNRRFCTLTNDFAGIKLPEPLARLHGIAQRRRPPVNLFAKKRVRGWFPLHGQVDQMSKDKRLKEQMRMQTGKIELELEILTEAEAASNPVGTGRNPPNALANPSRPDTSFNPFTNPLKAFHKVLLPVIVKGLIILGISAIIILVVVQFFSNLPMKLLGL